MLKDLYRMGVFAKVVEAGSFSGAAAGLGLGKSAVSEQVRALEQSIGVQLLARSTRALALTADGRRYYARCRQMLEAAEGASLDLDAQRQQPAGTIRLTAPYNLGLTFLIAQLSKFRELHPRIDLDLVLEDSISNLIEQGLDLALRVGPLTDTGLHAVRLVRCRMVVCAAPQWVGAHFLPRVPEDLMKVPWVSISQLPHPERLVLVNRNGVRRTVRVKAAVRTNGGMAARSFIVSGAGTGILPDYAVKDELESGALIRLLPDWHEEKERPISAIFPSRAQMPARVRVLLEFLKEAFQQRYGGSNGRL
jgi:DNA-binding transcriptional LysR family regulator